MGAYIGRYPGQDMLAPPSILPVVGRLESRDASDPRSTPARLTACVRAHHTFVWRCLRRLGVPAGSADDAAQHVFLALTRKVADVPVDRERAFLFGVAVRIAANFRRTSARVREDSWNDSPPEVACAAPNPHERLEQAERLAILDEVLGALPDELRTVFILAELERMTAVEIAACVEAPVGTVNSRLRRARELVEKNIRRVRAKRGLP